MAAAGTGVSVAVGAVPDPGVVGVCAGETDVSVGVDASPDTGVEGVRVGEAGVSVGVDAVRLGPVTLDGSSEPQAASAAVRASARTTLNRVTYIVVRYG